MGIKLVYVINQDLPPRKPVPPWLSVIATLAALGVFGWFVVAMLGVLLS